MASVDFIFFFEEPPTCAGHILPTDGFISLEKHSITKREVRSYLKNLTIYRSPSDLSSEGRHSNALSSWFNIHFLILLTNQQWHVMPPYRQIIKKIDFLLGHSWTEHSGEKSFCWISHIFEIYPGSLRNKSDALQNRWSRWNWNSIFAHKFYSSTARHHAVFQNDIE